MTVSSKRILAGAHTLQGFCTRDLAGADLAGACTRDLGELVLKYEHKIERELKEHVMMVQAYKLYKVSYLCAILFYLK